jgi:hypothetical protein
MTTASPAAPIDTALPSNLSSLIRSASVWQPGERPLELAVSEACGSDGIRWFDVEASRLAARG